VGPHEVTLRVHAASINPLDLAMQDGYGSKLFQTWRPEDGFYTLGRDCSGVVSRVGEEVWDFKEGDEVICAVSPIGTDAGTFAEYVNVPASAAAHKPRNLTHEEAASIPFAGLTAWSAAFTFGGAKSGQSVLIHGGGGGVGSIAIQLLKAHHCNVIATCGPRSTRKCQSMGADLVIDYTLQDLSTCPPVDLVIDAAGHPALLSRSLPLLKPWGTFVSLQGDLVRETDRRGPLQGLYAGITSLLWHHISYAASNRICYQWGFFLPNFIALNRMVDMAERGRLKPNVGKVYPFEQVEQAFRDLRDKEQHVGKVVLCMF